MLQFIEWNESILHAILSRSSNKKEGSPLSFDIPALNIYDINSSLRKTFWDLWKILMEKNLWRDNFPRSMGI